MVIILAESIVESLTHDFLITMKETPAKRHSKNIKKLIMFISQEAVEEISKLHERRANIHLQLVTDLENDKYKLADWDKATGTINTTCEIYRKRIKSS